MKKYAVIGLARTGQAVCKFLHSKGYDCLGIDTTTSIEKQSSISKNLPNIDLLFENAYEKINFSDIICVMSPGVPENSAIYQKILTDGSQIISDLDLFDEFNTKKTLAITGTNGKTTTVEMLHHILSYANIPSKIGANHGTGVLELLALDHEVNILELSSFQLQLLHKIDLLGSSILNITSNHIDRHHTFEGYVQAKKKIYDNSHHIILNLDDPITQIEKSDREKILIGKNNAKGLGYHTSDAEIFITADGKPIASSLELNLRGTHNIQNFLVSASLAGLVGVNLYQSIEAIKSFHVSPNRLEYINENYINDSKSTTIASTIAGIDSIIGRPIVLMLGGDSKNADLTAIIPVLHKLAHIVCFGRDGKKFYDICSEYVDSYLENDIEQAIKLAINFTKKTGGVLLFSPAGTSLDSFSSYDERGKFFKEIVSRYA